MAPTLSVATAASVLAMLPAALAGFNAGSAQNMAIYWGMLVAGSPVDYKTVSTNSYKGQNSYGQGSGSLAQQRLGYYCASKFFSLFKSSRA